MLIRLSTSALLRTAAVAATSIVAGALAILPASAAPVPAVPTPSWAPWSACPNQPRANCADVRAITRTSGGTVYLGGRFSELRSPDGKRSVPANNLAAIAADGTPAQGVALHSFNNTVYTLSTDGDDVFAGGAFTAVDGVNVGRVARFDGATGALDRTFAGRVGPGAVYASTYSAGRLFIGGKFATVRGLARGNLAALSSTDGAPDASWTPSAQLIAGDASPNDAKHNSVAVRSMALSPDAGRVYVAGDMDILNGVDRPVVGAVSALTGATDATFSPPSSVNKSFQGMQLAVADASDGRVPGVVLATGGLTNRAFRFNLTGSQVWQANTDGDVQAAAVVGDTVYLGGHFTKTCTGSCYDANTADDLPRMHIAAFTYQSTGNAVARPDWTPGLGPAYAPYYYGVWTLQAFGTELHAGGVFNSVAVNGVTHGQPKYARFGAQQPPEPTPTEPTQTPTEPTPTPTEPTPTPTEPTPTPTEPTPTPTEPTPTGPAAGALLFGDAFTSNAFTGWTSVGGGFTAADQMATGVTPGKIAVATKVLDAVQPTLDYSVRVRVRSTDPGANVILGRLAPDGSPAVSLLVRPNRTLAFRYEATTAIRSSSTTLDSEWHTVRMRVSIDGASSTTAVWLDGVPVPELTTTQSLGTTGFSSVQMGDRSGGRTYGIDYDDVEFRAGS